ncbi:ABC transporter ATP-binding protein [Dactylosporangium roseum]|uniref:ABC transporter ATP-binding protein n=1 Tax=Dactylosporangium roseum TaxID=47989 RepID=A0ABY5ZAM8_9ACTN|nr:ABC transporter ATP-binding protein [Dactylosporangium roseum]UWZ39140.1 ABC transporter ATP-binding protein [Dactylosporangium roseum]
MTVILRTSGLVHRYPDGREALSGVDVEIHQGEFVAIVGQNGSGKTTLAKHFNGLLRATAGTVEVAGELVRRQSTVELARVIGYCYQNPDHQIFAPTVRDEVRFGPAHLGLDETEIDRRTEQILALVDLLDRQDEYPFNLGRGERQKLAVASVLAIEPSVLIVDEPTTGLDWRGGEAMMGLVDELNRRSTTVIVITHDMNLVAEHARRVVVMAGGRKVGDGTPQDVFAQEEVMRLAHLRPPQAFRISQALPRLFASPTMSAREATGHLPARMPGQLGKR